MSTQSERTLAEQELGWQAPNIDEEGKVLFNPIPDETSWEYIFFDRQLMDERVDFALKMKLRHE